MTRYYVYQLVDNAYEMVTDFDTLDEAQDFINTHPSRDDMMVTSLDEAKLALFHEANKDEFGYA